MMIIEKPTTIQDLISRSTNVIQGEAVKGVVDLEKDLLAVDEPMHADIEQKLLELGSNQFQLWGINLHSDPEEELLEFDSMINIRPSQNNRSRGVENPEIQAKIRQIVQKWIVSK